MGISPEKPEQKHMSDLAIAKSLFEEINGGRPGGVKAMLNRVHDALKDAHKSRVGEARLRPWTHRKIRGIQNNEASIKYYEMMELAEAAATEKQERESLTHARNKHASFIANANRMRAHLIETDPDFHSNDIARLGRVISRVGGTGN